MLERRYLFKISTYMFRDTDAKRDEATKDTLLSVSSELKDEHPLFWEGKHIICLDVIGHTA